MAACDQNGIVYDAAFRIRYYHAFQKKNRVASLLSNFPENEPAFKKIKKDTPAFCHQAA
jgi:hypothetical protein